MEQLTLGLVRKLGLSNHIKDEKVLCPECLLEIGEFQAKTFAMGFVFHTPCWSEFCHPKVVVD